MRSRPSRIRHAWPRSAAHVARSQASSGFTLLECVIATLVMTLMTYGWMRLHSSHSELVASLDEELAEGTAYYVDKPQSEAARVLGVAAQFSRNTASLPDAPNPSAAFSLTILLRDRELRPPTASARVFMVEN